MSLLYWGAQHWAQYSRCGLTSAKQRGRITSTDLFTVLCLMQPRIPLAVFAARAPCWLMFHQVPQVRFYQATFQLDSPQHKFMPGVVPPQVQDFVLLLPELYEVQWVSPFLQPVEVPLDGSRKHPLLMDMSVSKYLMQLDKEQTCLFFQTSCENSKWFSSCLSSPLES